MKNILRILRGSKNQSNSDLPSLEETGERVIGDDDSARGLARVNYSPDGLHSPFHVREYDARELEILLVSYFEEVEVMGLHAGLDLALRLEVQDYEFGARIKALRAALRNGPGELRTMRSIMKNVATPYKASTSSWEPRWGSRLSKRNET